jgi:fibronectin-binding autotransporter adhesin
VSTAGTGKTSNITGGNVTLSQDGGTIFNIGAGDTLVISSKIDGDTGAADNGLIKNGAGTLVLSANNSYNSPTTINAGMLLLTGTLRDTSAVTLASGATMTGNGTANGSVTVQAGATVAPGGVAPVGTLTCGSATMAGTFKCQLDGTSSDSLVVTGALDLTGGTIELSTINPPTAPVVVIASAASITGTPTITGTVPAGYTLQTTATQVRLMSADAGFSGWIAGFGLAAADQDLDDDADADGIDNGIEYVLGGNPATVTDVAKLPQGTRSGGDFIFAFDRVVASETPDIVLSFQHGDNLDTWATVSLEAANPPQVTITRSGDNLTDHIVVTIPASGTKLFGRLKVSNP